LLSNFHLLRFVSLFIIRNNETYLTKTLTYMKTNSTLVPQFLLFGLAALLSTKSMAQDIPPVKTFPEIKGYMGIVNPIYTFSNSGNTVNFQNYYLFGMPCGINMWKTEKFGLSLEFSPFIKANNQESSMSYFLFHPGAMIRLGKGFTFIARAAFQTNGRYGFTPIISKVIIREKDWNLFGSFLLPARFGNGADASLTTSIMFGIGF